MGTNFYIKGNTEENRDNPDWHIGKRSAAGMFCFDCSKTLCKGGPSKIHYHNEFNKWYDECPICGQKPKLEGFDNSSAGLELGFNKNLTALKEGVATASSFTFAMSKKHIIKRVIEEFGSCPNNEKVIVNEYKAEFTYKEFLNILKTIPKSLQFNDMIGKEFS